MGIRSYGCFHNHGCVQEIKSGVEKGIHKSQTNWVITVRTRPINRKELQSKVMGSLLSMWVGSDLFEHNLQWVPKIEPITSYMIKEGVSVALKGQAGEIKVNAVLKIREVSFSSVYFCLMPAIATAFSLASVYLPCTWLIFGDGDMR